MLLVIDFPTSGYFEHWRRKGADKPSKAGTTKRISNEALLAHIRAIHTEVKQEYGWPKMCKELVALRLLPAQIQLAVMCRAITQVKVNQALVWDAYLLGNPFEVSN